MLQKWDMGFPVDCGASWESWTIIKVAVEKGVHKLATTKESIALIMQDVAYQVKACCYAQVISWEELKILRPKNRKSHCWLWSLKETKRDA
jgi:hypothetical protein